VTERRSSTSPSPKKSPKSPRQDVNSQKPEKEPPFYGGRKGGGRYQIERTCLPGSVPGLTAISKIHARTVYRCAYLCISVVITGPWHKPRPGRCRAEGPPLENKGRRQRWTPTYAPRSRKPMFWKKSGWKQQGESGERSWGSSTKERREQPPKTQKRDNEEPYPQAIDHVGHRKKGGEVGTHLCQIRQGGADYTSIQRNPRSQGISETILSPN